MRPSWSRASQQARSLRAHLRRLRDYHLAQNVKSSQPAARQQARAVLGWLREAAASQDEAALNQMITDYTEKHKPLAYILGTQPFANLELLIKAPVLIPRPETEEWTLRFLDRLRAAQLLEKPARVLDLCSGSGCISLAIAQQAPSFEVVGLDVSPIAVELARSNAARHSIRNVEFRKVDLFDGGALDNLDLGKFDYIVSNPPYIPEDQYHVLDRSVKDHEDSAALIGRYPLPGHQVNTGNVRDGLDFYHRISTLSQRYLKQDTTDPHVAKLPRVVLEVGQGQAAHVASIFTGHEIEVWVDFAGIKRNVAIL